MPRKRIEVKRHTVAQPRSKSYRFIPLTQGQNAVVDVADFEWLSQWNWAAHRRPDGKTFYAVRQVYKPNRKFLYMHKVILGCASLGDHINGDTLDNRRRNLRPCDHLGNSRNCKRSRRNTSGFKGAIWVKDSRRTDGGRWSARIRFDGKLVFLGYFSSARDAGAAYNKAAKKYFGEFANLNHI